MSRPSDDPILLPYPSPLDHNSSQWITISKGLSAFFGWGITMGLNGLSGLQTSKPIYFAGAWYHKMHVFVNDKMCHWKVSDNVLSVPIFDRSFRQPVERARAFISAHVGRRNRLCGPQPMPYRSQYPFGADNISKPAEQRSRSLRPVCALKKARANGRPFGTPSSMGTGVLETTGRAVRVPC
jgi:hypothetical protein